MRFTRRLASAALLALATVALAAETKEEAAPPEHATVEVRGETLFEIQTPTGRLSIADRAAKI